LADQAQALTLTHLDILVANQRRAVRWYTVMASGMVLLGLLVLGISLVWGGTLTGEPLKTIRGIAGGFISTGSAFPIRELLTCRDRLDVYGTLRQTFTAAAPDDAERIRGAVWAAISKVAGG
jgi:hypothetical protein